VRSAPFAYAPRALLGITLATAAAMKLHFGFDPHALLPVAIQMAAVPLELILAMGLLLGSHSRWEWIALLFGVCAVTLALVWGGTAVGIPCGCLGRGVVLPPFVHTAIGGAVLTLAGLGIMIRGSVGRRQ